MRIYLIGFMGSGKSTLGQQVAESLHVLFMDTDTLIEEQAGMSISGIFSLDGEPAFRELEAEVIRETTIHEKALIATGGGLPCHFENMQWMNDHGITMYLSWPTEILKSNLFNQNSNRPLLANLNDQDKAEKIELLFAERKPYYEMASITLEMIGDFEKDRITLEKACKYIW